MSRALQVEIRGMELRDVGRLTSLIQREGWEFDHSDIERILHIDPENSIISSFDGEVIGGITVCSMGSWALLGHVLVDERFRKKGVGQRLIETVLRKLDSAGVSTVEVFAEKHVDKFYRRNGFSPIEECAIFVKDLREGEFVESDHQGIRTIESSDIDDLLRIDRGICGFDRFRIINNFITHFPKLAFLSSDGGKLKGYVLARSSPLGSDVGPLISLDASRDTAMKLLQSVLSVLPGGVTYLIGPISNIVLTAIMRETGFIQKHLLVRMVRSSQRVKPYPAAMLGISATEYG